MPIYWPFSRATLNLATPWFQTIAGGWALDLRSARIAGIEIAFYGAVLIACLLLRRAARSRRRRLNPSRLL